MPDNQMLDAALEYASKGLYVHPLHTPHDGVCSCGRACDKPGKHPRTAHGFKDATTDPEQIRKWWAMWPDANIGIAGEPSHLQMIDIDPRDGGLQTWEHIANGRELNCPTVRSGGADGGLHLYLRDNREIKDLGPGIQVKYRGYVVAPPSLHFSGRRYAWLKPLNGTLPEVPAWIHKLPIIIEQTDPVKQAAETIINRWLDRAEMAPEGERNTTLNNAAYTLGGILHLGLNEGDVMDMLRAAGAKCGLPAGEVERLIKRSLAEGKQKPITLDVALVEPIFTEPEIEPISELSVDPWGEPLTMRDAYQSIAPLVYVVDKLIVEQSLTILYGDSGAMKSLLLADLAVCCASGTDFLDHFKTLCCPVMWLDWDNGKRRTNNRFGAFGRARNLPETAPVFYYSMPSPALDGANSKSVSALYTRIVAHGIKLVIIDNLGLVAGSADENSREMAQVIKGFRWLAEKTGAAFIIIHHQSKDSTGFIKKAGDKLRGHSSIKAGIDVALYVSRDMENEIPSNEIHIFAPKQRDFDVAPFGARFEYTSKQVGLLETACFVSIDYQSEGDRKKKDIDDLILEAISDAPLSVNQIRQRIGKSADTIKARLSALILSKQVTSEDGVYGQVYIRS